MDVELLVARYNQLYKLYGHLHRRPSPTERARFEYAQRELWALAQAICGLTNPHLQAELDSARRDVIAQVNLHVEGVGMVEVRPASISRPRTWPDYPMTPEFSVDPTLTGASITNDVVARLKKAHKEQVKVVYAIVHGRSVCRK